MNNNILLETSQAVYEPHVYADRELPFIFHKDHHLHGCPCNLHRNPELLLVSDGEGRIRNGDEILDVSAGDIVAVNPYTLHQVLSGSKLEMYCLIVDTDFCTANRLNLDFITFPTLIRDEALRKRYDRVIAEYENAQPFAIAGTRCAVLDLMVDLFRRFGQPCEDLAESRSSFEFVRKAMEYIKAHIGEKLTVSEIAANAGFSKFYFLRRFRECTGMTVVEYVNTLRCEHAKELLNSGRYSIKQVALACGFENFSYFTNVFKKYTGALPSEYVKRPESK